MFDNKTKHREGFVGVTGKQIPIVEGIVGRVGARGEMQSIYINDPDGNLVEISSYN